MGGTSNGAIVTVLPLDYHQNCAWGVSMEAQRQAKELVMGAEDPDGPSVVLEAALNDREQILALGRWMLPNLPAEQVDSHLRGLVQREGFASVATAALLGRVPELASCPGSKIDTLRLRHFRKGRRQRHSLICELECAPVDGGWRFALPERPNWRKGPGAASVLPVKGNALPQGNATVQLQALCQSSEGGLLSAVLLHRFMARLSGDALAVGKADLGNLGQCLAADGVMAGVLERLEAVGRRQSIVGFRVLARVVGRKRNYELPVTLCGAAMLRRVKGYTWVPHELGTVAPYYTVEAELGLRNQGLDTHHLAQMLVSTRRIELNKLSRKSPFGPDHRAVLIYPRGVPGGLVAVIKRDVNQVVGLVELFALSPGDRDKISADPKAMAAIRHRHLALQGDADVGLQLVIDGVFRQDRRLDEHRHRLVAWPWPGRDYRAEGLLSALGSQLQHPERIAELVRQVNLPEKRGRGELQDIEGYVKGLGCSWPVQLTVTLDAGGQLSLRWLNQARWYGDFAQELAGAIEGKLIGGPGYVRPPALDPCRIERADAIVASQKAAIATPQEERSWDRVTNGLAAGFSASLQCQTADGVSFEVQCDRSWPLRCTLASSPKASLEALVSASDFAQSVADAAQRAQHELGARITGVRVELHGNRQHPSNGVFADLDAIALASPPQEWAGCLKVRVPRGLRAQLVLSASSELPLPMPPAGAECRQRFTFGVALVKGWGGSRQRRAEQGVASLADYGDGDLKESMTKFCDSEAYRSAVGRLLNDLSPADIAAIRSLTVFLYEPGANGKAVGRARVWANYCLPVGQDPHVRLEIVN
ncbi:hypothetical protein [Ferrimonas marina]|nr:hypothetical protein [Ferrimonas marina]